MTRMATDGTEGTGKGPGIRVSICAVLVEIECVPPP